MQSMNKKLKQLIEFWPENRQGDAAEILLEMEQQYREDYRLTHEQLEEIDRRVADSNPRFMSLQEVRAELKHPRA